ncbi:MAG: hypothetical protein OEV37_00845 [Candidatus Berkelbacteria bacterium]|nr:hypothetical protein [Candidatus Berkelbacteria bacterium]
MKKISEDNILDRIYKIETNYVKELREFKAYINNTGDDLSVILKSHLFVEILINRIILLVIPHPKRIEDQRFSEKIKLLSDLDYFPHGWELYEKLNALNKIRNGFAHNYKNEIDRKHLETLSGCLKKTLSPIERFKIGSEILMNSLLFTIELCTLFPFIQSCSINAKLFRRDPGFTPEMISQYPQELLDCFYKHKYS